MKLKFTQSKQTFDTNFGEVCNISDGGYERGYVAGYEIGNSEGYTKGHAEGEEQGYADGYEVGSGTFDTALSGGSMDINSNITHVRDYACYGWAKLKTVMLPNATTIGTNAFRACNNMTYFYAPKVTSVGTYCFYTCSRLEAIDFSTLTSIPAQCFGISAKLSTLILRSTTMVTLGNVNAFDRTPISQGVGYIYVPEDLVEQYKTATNWSTYADQIRAIEDYPEIFG